MEIMTDNSNSLINERISKEKYLELIECIKPSLIQLNEVIKTFKLTNEQVKELLCPIVGNGELVIVVKADYIFV